MSRWMWTIALAAGVAVVALVLALRLSAAPENQAAAAERVAAALRCPDCQSLSVAESQTRAAAAIRSRIDAMLAEGRSADEVIDYFREQYGDGILLAPPSPWPWIVPLVAVAGGLAALAAWRLRRREARAPSSADGALDAATRRRIREDAEALDA